MTPHSLNPQRTCRTLLFLSAVALIYACSPKKTQEQANPLVTSIDSVVSMVVDTAGFNGNVLVSKGGTIIYQRSIGYANFDTKTHLNDSSVFELASVSKQFTAMCIMMLQERGKLNFEDDVRKYIPELPYQGMTIRHLLTHTSGIPDYMGLFSEGWNPKVIAFNKDVIELLVKRKPAILFRPGEKWEYSNTAFVLLASIIERVSGMTFSEFLKQNIFVPLEMKHSRTYNTRRSKGEVIPNYAYGFVYHDSLKRFVLPDSLKELSVVITLDGIQGDGIVNSTTGDLFKWDQALYTEKLVTRKTLDQAFTPSRLNNDSIANYGFGWGIGGDSVTGRIVSHGGGWPGYNTFIVRYIDKNTCIIVLSNNGGLGLRTLRKKLPELLFN